jgi:drug/metabolite transporter (DMT)-like permease
MSSIIYQMAFLTTGILTTILNQYMAYSGAGEKSTLLLSIPTWVCIELYRTFLVLLYDVLCNILLVDKGPICSYVGMMMVACLNCGRSTERIEKENFRGDVVFFSALVDVVSNVICTIGLHMIGSGLFQVSSFYLYVLHKRVQASIKLTLSNFQLVYSAVIGFAAIMSRVFLHKQLSLIQSIGIAIIFFGLIVTSIDVTSLTSVVAQRSGRTWQMDLDILVGIAITLLGCIGYAGNYVLNEFILLTMPSLDPKRLCMLVGSWGCLLVSAYIAAYTVPNWDALVAAPMRSQGGDARTVAALYLGLTLCSFAHNLAYFHLLRLTGAVSTGVLTALRTIGVLVGSSALFCDASPVQCLTGQKLLALLLICAGVLTYAWGSAAGRRAGRAAAAAGGAEEGGLGAGDEGEVDLSVLRDLLQEALEPEPAE